MLLLAWPALGAAQNEPATSPGAIAPPGSDTPPTASPASSPTWAPDTDEDQEIVAPATAPAGAAESASGAVKAAPPPGPAPSAAPPAPSAAAPSSAPAIKSEPAAAKAPTASTARTEPEALDTDSMLAEAGYPLTPGVSALPVRSEFVLSGYIQAQYEAHDDSIDQLRQGGVPYNQDRFLLRRGRVKVTRDWEYAQIIVEIDGNTTRGPTVRFQKAEASLIYGRSKDRDQPPMLQATLGEFDLPFGFEVPYVPKVRWFMERTTGSRALFPSEPDVGARVSGGIGFARYSLAITNGEPLDEKTGFPLRDPNKNKDFTGRLGAESKLSRNVVLAGGVSFNQGKGLHAVNTDATKNVLGWQDTNENGTVDPGEVVGSAGSVGMRAQNFKRWAVAADAELLVNTKLGWTMLYGEVVAASNLDRGLFIADPVLNGSAIRELSYYAALTQEITRYGIVGFRYEFYDPNADLLDKRANKILPTSQAVTTYSPLIGLVLPGQARLLFEWDIIRDFYARDSRGVPTDLKNNQLTLRMQGML